MQLSLATAILCSTLFGPLLGFFVAWWMFPHDAVVIYAIAALAGVYYLLRQLCRCGLVRTDSAIDRDCRPTG